jgi:hypothetical protein
MGRAKGRTVGSPLRQAARAKSLLRGSDGIQADVIVTGFGRERTEDGARSRMVNVTLMCGNRDPRMAIAYLIGQALDKANKVCPVKQYPERIGEVRNLKDPEAQARSLAAIFIKKYRFVSHPLAVLYTAIRKRELTAEECSEILGIVSRLGVKERDEAMLGWLDIMERGGEGVRLRADHEEDEHDSDTE